MYEPPMPELAPAFCVGWSGISDKGHNAVAFSSVYVSTGHCGST